MSQLRQYFGTDGIRGKVGEAPITPDFVLKLGYAIGKVLATQAGSQAVIGKDTRISGYLFESALQAGLSAAGMDIHLLGPLPTPAIAYLTRKLQAQVGIVISASHNAYTDNGIKLFSGEGFKLDDSVELAIEEAINQPLTMQEADKLGKAYRVTDALDSYADFCAGLMPENFDLSSLHIVVDCANGAAYQVAPKVLERFAAKLTVINNEPDGLNINEQCGSTKPQALRDKVLELGADLGIAFDGDADRVVMVDNNGELIEGDELIYIIAKNRIRKNEFSGGVVGTQMSNLGLELALGQLGIEFVRANVGDRHVIKKLKQLNWELGGECSGHIVDLNSTTTGDGLVAALHVLLALQENQSSLSEIKQGMQKFPQTIINVAMPNQAKPMQQPQVVDAVKAAENLLGERGRILLRPSGTEPLLRVMVEGEELQTVNQVAQGLADEVRAAINSQ